MLTFFSPVKSCSDHKCVRCCAFAALQAWCTGATACRQHNTKVSLTTFTSAAAVAALQGSMLLLLGPWVDAWVSGRMAGF
jgi:hypothetical protein